jgi:hypothetical protein
VRNAARNVKFLLSLIQADLFIAVSAGRRRDLQDEDSKQETNQLKSSVPFSFYDSLFLLVFWFAR